MWQDTRANGIPIIRCRRGKSPEKLLLLLQGAYVTIYPEKRHAVKQGLTSQK
jgi:hypothetical protein